MDMDSLKAKSSSGSWAAILRQEDGSQRKGRRWSKNQCAAAC
jgi:hypothetical protein